MRTIRVHFLGCAPMVFAMNVAAFAQWVSVTLPNTPRTPDGKPILSAPVPKAADGKPDLSGLWRTSDGRYLQDLAADQGGAPLQSWAAALYNERSSSFGK